MNIPKSDLIFNNLITTEEQLRDLLGHSSELVKNKTINYLDEHCVRFISQSPFVLLSTSDHLGLCDASPRGDAPGFVSVIDEYHLVIPERPGNRKLDSIRNILHNPQIGLLFLIPGLNETLRINGKAFVTQDKDILEAMDANGKTPLLGIGVRVEECFVHCAKAFMRSKLWQPEAWPTEEELPNPAKMLADHAKLPTMTEKEVIIALQESYTKRLY